MVLLLDVLSWLLLVAGGFFVIVGGVGLVRMPDFFTRIHAASITDTLGAGLIVLGLLLQSPEPLGAFKLILVLVFLVITSPTATHALAKAALHGGLRPEPQAGPDSAEDTPSRS